MPAFGALDPMADQIETVWLDPTRFDPVRHGPPFLPDRPSVKLGSDEKTAVWGWVKQAQVGSGIAELLGQMAGEYQGCFTGTQDRSLSWLSALLACLRSAAWMHQSHHWQTRGQSYYADHLLFDRLYNESLKPIDQIAERTVGLGIPTLVDPVRQAKHLVWCISKCYEGAKADEGPNGMVLLSLHKEYRVLEAIKIVIEVLSQANCLSDGTENLLQDVADKHEEFVYLLKQRANVPQYSYAR